MGPCNQPRPAACHAPATLHSPARQQTSAARPLPQVVSSPAQQGPKGAAATVMGAQGEGGQVAPHPINALLVHIGPHAWALLAAVPATASGHRILLCRACGAGGGVMGGVDGTVIPDAEANGGEHLLEHLLPLPSAANATHRSRHQPNTPPRLHPLAPRWQLAAPQP